MGATKPSERVLRARLRTINEEAESLRAALDDARSRRQIRCTGCNRTTRVSKLTYIQTHFYIAPYSCTGGDYWRQGEGQYDCPKCGHRNRLYNRPDVEKLKRLFGGIVEVHD